MLAAFGWTQQTKMVLLGSLDDPALALCFFEQGLVVFVPVTWPCVRHARLCRQRRFQARSHHRGLMVCSSMIKLCLPRTRAGINR